MVTGSIIMNVKENGTVISLFSQALMRGESALVNAPGLLRRIIDENMWQKYYDEFTKEEYMHENFMSFITSKPREGLGETVENIIKICRDDKYVLDKIDELTQRPNGGDRKTEEYKISLYNIQTDNAPTGTSTQSALRRLRKDRPDLHEQVINNKLTAHAAMIQAGFRKKTVTVPVDNVDKCVEYIKKYFTIAEIMEALKKE